MGIKELYSFLEKNVPTCVTQAKNLQEFSGKTFAIDITIFIVAFTHVSSLISVKTNGAVNRGEKFIELFKNQFTVLKENDIRPIYVFDGPPTEIKQKELEKRKFVGTKTGESYYCQILKNIFKKYSIDFIVAEHDAEKECAKMCNDGRADFVVSSDGDALVFGAPEVIINLSVSKTKQKSIKIINSAKILLSLGLTRLQFVDFCILCGSDYTDKIKGIGPKKALEIIKKYNSLDNWIRQEKTPPVNFNYQQAQVYFTE